MKKFEITVDKDSVIPIYKQIYTSIRDKIEKAELLENSKLPSIRQLAIKLKVNNLTILKAYNLLENEDYIYKRQGQGVFVNKKDMLLYFSPPGELIEMFKEHDHNKIIDFVSGTPSSDILPFDDFKEISNFIFNNHSANIMSYQDLQGNLSLRALIKEQLEKENIYISEKNIQITSGSQQGISLIMNSLISSRNNKIVVGNPTYHGALNTFKKYCTIFNVPIENDGFDLESLEAILKTENILFIYTMMDYQSPTGISWSSEKRKKIVELAEKYNTFIIDDDCLSDIYFGDKKNIPLKYFDKDNRTVISIKSYSKNLMPGIRLGYMLVPDNLVSNVMSAKFTADISSSGFEQAVLAEFLRSQRFEKHLEKLRQLYRERYEYLKDQLDASTYLETEYDISGGFYLWIKLPSKINSNDLYIKCKKNGISILPGSVFSTDESGNQFFRLSFASASKKDITLGVKEIDSIISFL